MFKGVFGKHARIAMTGLDLTAVNGPSYPVQF